MAATPSKMLALGTKLPEFELVDTISGDLISSSILNKKANLIMFICNHCPYVIHIVKEISKLATDYKDRDFAFIAISSNDITNYPQDSPEKMKEFAKNENFTFPYLFDESQNVARNFQAACTPDIFLFNNVKELVYRGQFDDSRPSNLIPVTGQHLRQAIDDLLNNITPDSNQIPSIGCNIKWK